MTKFDLIRRLAKKASVPESDAMLFFEFFLKRIAGKIKPGMVIKFPDVGYFSRKNGKFTTAEKDDSSEHSDSELIDLIVYSNAPEKLDAKNECYIFKLTGNEYSEPELDSHFSMSLGKPVFRQDKNKPESLIPPKTGAALINYIDSKAELIASQGKILEEKQVQKDFIIHPSSTEIKLPVSKTADNKKDKELRDMAWGFGEDISAKIDRKVSSDTEKFTIRKSQENNSSRPDSLPWDFGSRKFDRGFETSSNKKEDNTKQIKQSETENKNNTTGKEEKILDRKPVDEKSEVKKEEEDKADKKVGNFERVNSFINAKPIKFSINKKPPRELDKMPPGKEIEEETDGGFTEVKSKSVSYNLNVEMDKKSKEEEKDIVIEEEPIKWESSYKKRRKKKKYVPVLLTLASVLIIGAVLLFTVFTDAVFNNSSTNLATNEENSSAEIIERNYDVPVTYPYPKEEGETEIKSVSNNVFSETGKTTTTENETAIKDDAETKTETKVEEPSADESPDNLKTTDNNNNPATEDDKIKSASSNFGTVEKHIYKYKDYFVVQLGSFKSYTAAEQSAKKYEDEGYNSFIEIAEVPGKGTWFRVRVGDFTSLQKAEEFYSNNVK